MSLRCSVGAAARPSGDGKGPGTKSSIGLPRVSVIQRADGKVGRVQRSSIHLPRSVGAAGTSHRQSGDTDEKSELTKRHIATEKFQRDLRTTSEAVAQKSRDPATRNQPPAGACDGELPYRY